jgi:hypothetical protein
VQHIGRDYRSLLFGLLMQAITPTDVGAYEACGEVAPDGRRGADSARLSSPATDCPKARSPATSCRLRGSVGLLGPDQINLICVAQLMSTKEAAGRVERRLLARRFSASPPPCVTVLQCLPAPDVVAMVSVVEVPISGMPTTAVCRSRVRHSPRMTRSVLRASYLIGTGQSAWCP